MWPGSISIGSKDDEPTRRSFREWGLAVFAYSCLGRGFFSDAYWNREQVDQTVVGDGGQDDRVHKTMQWLRARFHSPSNIEKYRRAELLSKSRGVTPAQIGLAYVFHKDLDVFAVVGWTHNCRCDLNAAALDITLSQDEVEWLEGC
jgi:aryl-alcohol dehydrogenase-like predicted oxidoreductase